ncbi:MAG: HAD hydrolase family protein [Methylophilaceae bacterium]|nr:HAD hydrolase family protein [Methylophilaceae bacterium]
MTPDLLKRFSSIKFIAFDFDGVFTDNLVHTTEAGEEFVTCWRSDGLGLSKLKKLGIPVWVISTEKNPVVSMRCNKLEIECLQSCNDKLSALIKLLEQSNCNIKDAAFVGNDINDSECLKKVGLPIVVADSHEDIKHLALYETKKNGGKGAVREICDLIVECHLSS